MRKGSTTGDWVDASLLMASVGEESSSSKLTTR